MLRLIQRFPSLIIVLLVTTATMWSQSIQLINFETRHTSAPYQPSPQQHYPYQLFRASLSVLPEESIIPTSVLGASLFYNFQQDSPTDVSLKAAERYVEVKNDSLTGPLPSTLKYSFSKTKPDHGFYYLYTPNKITDESRFIVFLHGLGGCFKYYVYFFKKFFPNDIVVLPVYGYSGGIINASYLIDLWRDLKPRVAFNSRKPWLIGLSAGGYSVFRLYGALPSTFSGGIAIASYCHEANLPHLKRNMNILMINGDNEQGLPITFLEKQKKEISRRVDNFQFDYIEGSHFFLFWKETEVAELIEEFIEQTELNYNRNNE